jgi:hypothetical protein
MDKRTATPRPERTRVILVNTDGDATKHVYSETRIAFGHRGTPGYEHIFTCTVTRQRRRYGFDDGPGLPEPLPDPALEGLAS